MWSLPFISLRSHRETISAKDETIAILRETLKQQAEALESLKQLAESLKPKPPAVRIPRGDAEQEKARRKVDYANLDPSDTEAIAAAALLEVGPGKHNAARLQQRMEHIRRQIRMNRQAQAERAQQPGPPPPPSAILDQIEQTIEQGRAAAAGAN